MHWNAQGLVGKLDELQLIWCTHDVGLVGACEHWLSEDNMLDINFSGYDLESSYHRPSGRSGGPTTFLSSNLEYGVIEISIPHTCEIAAVFIRCLVGPIFKLKFSWVVPYRWESNVVNLLSGFLMFYVAYSLW